MQDDPESCTIQDHSESSSTKEEPKSLTISDESKSSTTQNDHKSSLKLKPKSKELKKEVGLNRFFFRITIIFF